MLAELEEQVRPDLDKISSHYLRNEAELIRYLLSKIALDDVTRTYIEADATSLVANIRRSNDARTPIDDLLQEYGLSTDEGVMLMRLSEALIRTPDFATSRRLIRDKIGDADWAAHAGKSDSFLVNRATTGLRFTSGWIAATGGTKASNLLAKLGDRVMDRAMAQAMSVMGNHFVLGRNIEEACDRGKKNEAKGFAHSYDMLGEAAYTHADAERYFASYLKAINFLASRNDDSTDVMQRAGLSVKLSALHPRYEHAKREECVPLLVERMIEICRVAARADLWLNIDAEEADRLELSLEIFDRLLLEPSLKDWCGLGMVVQAYQRRALPVLEHLQDLSALRNRSISIRLVKGAYWDMEIKRAQELGLSDYPVFTRKENTDVSYLACARTLLDGPDRILPQFATHNAHTAISITHMADKGRIFEFQRLHGMGAALHAQLAEKSGVQSRIYAPVGSHKDLLPYLVRRLLENGANGSFVNQMMDESVPALQVAADPISIVEANTVVAHPKIPSPTDTVEPGRLSAKGIDLTQSTIAKATEEAVASETHHNVASVIGGEPAGSVRLDAMSPQNLAHKVGTVTCVTPELIDDAVKAAEAADWATKTSAKDRAMILNKAADLLEEQMPSFLELCVREAGKSIPDAVAEVREAIDFCRYYAAQSQTPVIEDRQPLGVVACISPWNFPLAIFLGQVVAALSVGNTVIAKPAAQTPIIAAKAVELLQTAGVPANALQLALGDGALLGDAIVKHPSIGGVCFTGSTRTAKIIGENLSSTGRGDIPFIAETGGINAMIVDSTALLEQAVQDVVNSAFQSAGQRCSACRVVCVQEDIAEDFIEMLTGAMKVLKLGDPAQLSTDVGPVIDETALENIETFKDDARARDRVIYELHPDDHLSNGFFSGPTLIEIDAISDLKREIFGPVLHLVRFKAEQLHSVIDEINKLGYGLTMGLHTRLDDRIEDVASRAHVGNLYVNRNQIGAVVGVHPFGGEGLSGTGPKAGGPHYLFGLTQNVIDSSQMSNERIKLSDLDTPESADPELLERAEIASKNWQASFAQSDRLSLAGEIAMGLSKAELSYQEITDLPGPTGEKNTLRLCPRGVVLSFGGDTLECTQAQVARAISAGSSVILASEHKIDLGKTLSNKQIPKHLIQHTSLEVGLALTHSDIDAIAADGRMRSLVASIASQRTGSILSILSGRDPIERFLHERTLTINTTAAGGNASLLAMQ